MPTAAAAQLHLQMSPFLPYGTVMTTGTLHVGEVFDEYGYVRSLYRIDADSVVEPDY